MKRSSVAGRLSDAFIYSFMILFCISILYPVWDMLIVSIDDPQLVSLTFRLWPHAFVTDSYVYAFSDNRILQALTVSVYRTVAGTLLTLALLSLAAYTLSKRDLPLRNFLTTIFLVPMFFSGGIIPTYIIIRSLGLIDNLLVYILPGAVSIFSLLILRNFFMSIDKALEESAFMDGAGYMTILFRIVVPLAKPVLATVALWSLVGHWNAWFDSMIYIRSDSKIVMQYYLQKLIQSNTSIADSDGLLVYQALKPNALISSKSFQAAVTIITISPIIAAYPFLQKYFVKGIMIGSLKG